MVDPTYKWVPTSRIGDLTVVMVARNLVRLCYPFLEALTSTIPLGCHYLVGDFGSDDGTSEYLRWMQKFVPLEIVNLEWPPEPGWGAVAIGIATQRVLSASPTEYAVNLQACEVWCKDAIQETLQLSQVSNNAYKFRHFYGSMHHGGPAYGGYGEAPRLVQRDVKFDRTDGAWPNPGYGGALLNGWINRYGYCFHNTIEQKMLNRRALYNEWAGVEGRIAGCKAMGANQTWGGGHEPCVAHLLDCQDYDIVHSQAALEAIIAPLG